MTKKKSFEYSFDLPQSQPVQSVEQIFMAALNLHQQGNLEQAEKIYREIIARYPDHSDALNLLGVIESKYKRYEIAERLLSKAISINPAIARYHNNLGMVLEEQSRLMEARNAYEEVLHLDPNLVETTLNLARLMSKIGNYKEAEALFEKAINLSPERVDSYFGLAELYQQTKQGKKIETLYKKALEMMPEAPEIYQQLGLYYQEVGQLAEAEAAFRKALEINPDLFTTYFNLAHVQKHESLDIALAEQIKLKLAQLGTENDEMASSLHFALGKIFNDANMYDDAFRHYSEGNLIKHKLINKNPDTQGIYINKIIDTFTREFIEASRVDVPSDLPVFLIGMPRSGSTLIEQIISSHPDAAGAGELTYFEMKTRFIPRQFETHDVYPDCIRQLNTELLTSVAWEYLGILRKEAGEQKVLRVTDKQLYNFLHVGFIRMLFPKARIIHCRREPMDNCLAIFVTSFKSDANDYAYDLAGIGHFYRDYLRLMEHWRNQVSEPMLEVDYESLITHQEEESRRIIDFIGLDWDDRCLEFYKTERSVRTASSWQVRQPLYKGSLNRWKHYEKHLAPLKQALES